MISGGTGGGGLKEKGGHNSATTTDKVDQLDDRKITIHSKKVSCQS